MQFSQARVQENPFDLLIDTFLHLHNVASERSQLEVVNFRIIILAFQAFSSGVILVHDLLSNFLSLVVSYLLRERAVQNLLLRLEFLRDHPSKRQRVFR